MRLNKSAKRQSLKPNMTPMIDVTFLLLIFFISVNQITEANNEPVELPKLQGSNDLQPSVLTVNVMEDGQTVVSGETVSIDRFISIVTNELTRQGDDPSRVTVVVRADKRSDARPVNEIVRALTRLQITKIRIAVQVPE
ncbi:MAG TPA: hypothetical protein DCY79_07445 [Planctomycetaceae bacterium]|nr:hypothetical protein [Blastopirellula sp.]HAY79624.1 hypothetical protein [Planctomycetaceae bacterium]